VVRHPATAFLVMAFGLAWTSILPLLLSQSGPFGVLPFALPFQPFAAIMSILGLALPAFLVTAAKDGKEGVRDLLRRGFRWRVGVHWYLIALLGLLAATLLGAIPFLGVAPLEALARNWSLLFTVFLPGVLIPFVLVNLWEELGWTGFMQHTLQETRAPTGQRRGRAALRADPPARVLRRRFYQRGADAPQPVPVRPTHGWLHGGVRYIPADRQSSCGSTTARGAASSSSRSSTAPTTISAQSTKLLGALAFRVRVSAEGERDAELLRAAG
jgi:membrane protease YdiL (CAAX protease family)